MLWYRFITHDLLQLGNLLTTVLSMLIVVTLSTKINAWLVIRLLVYKPQILYNLANA